MSLWSDLGEKFFIFFFTVVLVYAYFTLILVILSLRTGSTS